MSSESKITNNKMQIPILGFWWKGRKILSICILGFLLFVTPVSADLINGDFQTGDLTGWTYSGVTIGGSYYARITNTGTGDYLHQDFLNDNWNTTLSVSAYLNGAGAWLTVSDRDTAETIYSFNYNYLVYGTTTRHIDITGHYNISIHAYCTNNYINFNYFTLSGYAPPPLEDSINFVPDVESTNESTLYYDYSVGENHSENNTFIYSIYEPETTNVSTFQGYVNETGENIQLGPLYLGGNYSINLYYGPFGPADLSDATLIVSDNIYVNISSTTDILEYTQSNYTEYETSIINYNITSYMLQYPSDEFYLTMITPQNSYDPYYYYENYELTIPIGSRTLEIGEKSSVAYPDYQNCTAWITKYNDTDPYVIIGEAVFSEVLNYNHTLLEYTNYDWWINESYITGQYISIRIDIEDYIETDYLGYPDELFTIWTYAYSNSNEGNVYDSHDLNSGLWSGNNPYNYVWDYKPYIDNNFNATIESYITVYRLGNTTQLTPTIYTNMYASGYIPEGESGYIPPDMPEEPEDPEIPPEEPGPENPEIPNATENFTGTNLSINVSWMDGYYNGINATFDTLLIPIYNFTVYSVSPINQLNDTIDGFNYEMNISFTETSQKIGIFSEAFNIILNSIHPKVVNVITYYLMWLVLLIILKKR